MKFLSDIIYLLDINNLIIEEIVPSEYLKISKDLEIGDELELREDLEIKEISYDSREVEEDWLFFCKGKAFKEEYLHSAISRGVKVYISEVAYQAEAYAIIVSDIRRAMISVAAYFFNYPDDNLAIIGVTGTKGKTTTVKFLKSILDEHLIKNGKKPCGIISSINVYDGVVDEESKLTTPESIPLYRHLYHAVESGLEYMIIEVSSQALKYDRITEIRLDLAAFLNIGDDHVSANEHPDFEDYLNSKLKIIDQAAAFIFNSQTDHYDQVFKKVSESGIRYASFSLRGPEDDIYAENIRHEDLASSFTAVNKGKKEEFTIKEPGNYNIENALCAIYIAHYFGLDAQTIAQGLIKAKVDGRNVILRSDDQKIIIWVSYAHNGLSFQKTFESLEAMYGDVNIISMFGTPGDRAKSRLVDMSTLGGQHSDHVIIVPDDPGSRSFEEIADEMEEIMAQFPVTVERRATREEGVKRAFAVAKKDRRNLFFLAGKGADTHDFVKGQYLKIESDLSLAKKYLDKYNKESQI